MTTVHHLQKYNSYNNPYWLSFKTGKNCYPQVFLEKCKYRVKKETIKRYTTEELTDSDSDC